MHTETNTQTPLLIFTKESNLVTHNTCIYYMQLSCLMSMDIFNFAVCRTHRFVNSKASGHVAGHSPPQNAAVLLRRGDTLDGTLSAKPALITNLILI